MLHNHGKVLVLIAVVLLVPFTSAHAANASGVTSPSAQSESQLSSTSSSNNAVAVGLSVGTLGVGIEGVYRLLPSVNVRGQFNYFDYSHHFNTDGNDYSGGIHFLSAGALADWYPLSFVPVIGRFRFTGGVYLNFNKIKANGSCSGGCTAGNLTITSTGSDPATELDPSAWTVNGLR